MRFVVPLGVVIASSFGAAPAQNQKQDANYVMFRIKTDLQRELLFPKGTRNFVAVNGDAIVAADGSVQPKAIDLHRLYLDLMEGHIVQDELGVVVNVLYKKLPPEHSGAMLKYALTGAAHGPFPKGFFKEISVTSAQESPDRWHAVVAAAQESRKPGGDLPEPGLRAGLAAVYAVRTPLSRWKSDGCDCVVVVGDMTKPAPEAKVIADLEKLIAPAIEKLKVARTERVCFYYGARPRDPAAENSFNVANKELAKKLGFKTNIIVNH
jgi:hypothetical protein